MFRLLASYPKSGNTWVRIFLAHYLRGNTNLNTVGFPVFGSVAHFPLGNPKFRKNIPAFDKILYAKTHETGHRFFASCVSHAIYIIRSPFDIVPSYARHMSIDLDKAVDRLGNSQNHLVGSPSIYPQHISDWSTHVLSWLQQDRFKIFYVRYESLKQNPEAIFRNILEFLGVEVNEEKLKLSLAFSAFENLKKTEESMLAAEKAVQSLPTKVLDTSKRPIHFKEAKGSTGRFFNYGRSGGGKEVLSPEQIDRIYKRHRWVIDLLKYAP